MFTKIAKSQEFLRLLREKQAGIAIPLVAGATVAGGVMATKKGLSKAHEYRAGFTPNFNPGSSE